MSDARFKEAIATLNTAREKSGVDMGGKKYSMVKDRVEVFRSTFGAEFGIDTNVDYNRGFDHRQVIVCSAKIVDGKSGTILASGHAMEYIGSNPVTLTSAIEAVETSAIGRALACFGLHGGEYASDSEMQAIPRKQENAPVNQSAEDFRRDVEQTFPAVGQGSGLYIPVNNSPEEIDKVFMSIDECEDSLRLSAYFNELEEMLQWVEPSVAKEIKASFKGRNSQLTGAK